MRTVRRWLSGFVLAGMVGGGILLWLMRYRFPYRPVLERIVFTLPPGHERLAGLTIGFVTDTHINPAFRRRHLERGLTLLLDERPDLLLLGGDYLSETTRHIDQAAPALGTAARRVPLGALAVLGNHDLGGHGPAVRSALRREGIRLLENEAAEVRWHGDSLWVVGIDDTLLGEPNPEQAFAQVPPGAAALTLWHEPDAADTAAAFGSFAQLSGHSHGGQIRVAGLGEMAAPAGGRKYPIGHYRIGEMQLYVSRGLGTYRPPLRLNCPPEVTLITLVTTNT